jgi:hypothetical protein
MMLVSDLVAFVAILFTAGMAAMSVALLLSVRTSRRSARWHEQRTADAVDRVVDRMIVALADDTEPDE